MQTDDSVMNIPLREENVDWQKVINTFVKATSYKELERQVLDMVQQGIPPVPSQVKMEMTSKDRCNDVAMNYYPSDGPKHVFPVATYGGGNCFPQCILHIIYGNEDHHLEIRAHIIIEGVKYKEKLTRSSFLLQRRENVFNRNTATQYLMYSGIDCNTGRNVTQQDINYVYEQKLLNICKPGSYMGIWQFHQCVEIFNRPLGSVYPSGTNPRLRHDLNRIILPSKDTMCDKSPIYVMWMPLHMYSKAYQVKHFVPLMQKTVYDLFHFMQSIHNFTVNIMLFTIFITIFITLCIVKPTVNIMLFIIFVTLIVTIFIIFITLSLHLQAQFSKEKD